jgi:hypothetical protein
VVGADGVLREVDTLIFATGFHVTDMPFAQFIRGRDGAGLDDLWQGSPAAYRGASVPGFPNLFWIVGPNTGLGHNSMVHVIESQLAYIVDYIRTLDRSGADALDTDARAQQAWCDDVERRMGPTVWSTGGCKSWYLNEAGRNPILWPGSTVRFRRKTRRVDESEYVRISAPTPTTAAMEMATNGADQA